MTDAALANAHSRRDMLSAQINVQQQQLNSLRRELEVVDEFIRRWHTFAMLEDGQPIIQADKAVDKIVDKEKRTRPANPSRESVGDVVEQILREWGRPASRADLFEELAGRDVIIQGTDPQMVFSTMLWRMKDRFERLKGRGYWLKNERVPGDFGPVEDDPVDLLGDLEK